MSLRLKTILGVAAIEAVLLLILITTVLGYMRNASENSLAEYAATTSTLFATTTKDAVISYDLASLESFTKEILTNQGIVYVRVLDANNTILAQGGDAKLLQQVFNADSALAEVDDGIYDTFSEINEGGANYGRVEIGISTDRIQESITETRRLAAIIAFSEMGLVALFSFFLGVYLTRQLKYLRYAAKEIAAGNFDHKVTIRSRDEIAEVSRSFNKMSENLSQADKARKQYQTELESLNTELENRVKRRTAQILEKNQELESAYDQLKNTQSQLLQSEKMASVGQLAAGVAHEINNPVGFVSSNLSTLKDYIQTYKDIVSGYESLADMIHQSGNESLKLALEKIQQQNSEDDIEFINEDIEELIKDSIDGTKRVTEIVQGLKTFSHVDQEATQSADINECIESTLKVVHNEIKYTSEIVKNLEPLPLLECNPGKLNQVFMNLIINASQAIDDQGTITINTYQQNDNIVISIADTGSGIAKENLSKLFDPFFTTKPVGTGTGLGLSISHGIIEEHHGTIEVASELGKGTTFTITLPLTISQTSRAVA